MVNDEITEIDLRRLDLNLLVVFAALMHERSVRRAAGRLFIVPSAVSMALRRLREVLGDPLFVRGAGTMAPTPRALALYERIGPALRTIRDATLRPASFDPARIERTIRFASPDDLEIVLLPRLLARLKRRAPGVTLVVRPADFRTVPGMLDRGDAEVALTATPQPLERRHRQEILYREGFEALFHPKRLDAKAPLTLAQYLSVPHVLSSASGALRGAIDERLAELGTARRVFAAVPRFSTLPFVLERLPVLANVPARAARAYAKAFRLTASPLPFASPTFEVSLVWAARFDGDPTLEWFRGEVRAVLDRRKGG